MIILAQRKDVEAVLVQLGHHAVGRGTHRDRRGVAFEDLGHVPHDGRGVALENNVLAPKIKVQCRDRGRCQLWLSPADAPHPDRLPAETAAR